MPAIYFQPVRKKAGVSPMVGTSKLLTRLARIAVEEIRREVDRLPYDGKQNIKRSIHYKVLPSSVTITSDHPAFKFVEEGVRPHVMKYVKNRLVKIDIADLHNPTARDYRQGYGIRKTSKRPFNPGMPAEHFVKHGIARARLRFMEELQKQFLGTSP